MEPKLLEKILLIVFLLFGTGFYTMKIIYKLVDRKNGKKDPPDPPDPPSGPKPGEAQVCIERGQKMAVIEVLLPRIDRAVGELYRDRFGVDPR